MKTTMVKCFFLLILSLYLSACKSIFSHSDDDSPFQGIPADKLYDEAKKQLTKEEYSAAIKRFEALDTMYPFNEHTEQAQLYLIYSYYKKEDYASTAATAERFIHLYPTARHVDYAYYMKAMANFHQLRGALANVVPMDQSLRDPGTQSQAYADFATLVQKFPKSRYQPSALQHMIYLRNQFAQRELNAAIYYYQRKLYVASAQRATYLITTYPQAPSVKLALTVAYHAYLQLGLKKAAQDSLRVYQATFHQNPGAVPTEKTNI